MSITTCAGAGSVPVNPTFANACGGGAFLVFMTLVESYIRNKSDVEDVCGRATPRFRKEPERKYDFVVVGSGCAGSVVAARLSEISKWKVLLVERGDDEPLSSQIPANFIAGNSEVDYNYQIEKNRNAFLAFGGAYTWLRGKVLGGTSVLNGMMYTRGNAMDYDTWKELGNPTWSYKEVLPFFKSLENNGNIDQVDPYYHGVGGPWPIQYFNWNPPMSYDILKGGQQMGYYTQDLNGYNATGFMIAQMFTKDGQRYSLARACLRPARNRKNLHIMLNSTVTKLNIDKTKTVKSIVISDGSGKLHTVKVNKEVIISGGAINSPQVLLLSGIGPKAELKKAGVPVIHDLPGVGKNLKNHVSIGLRFSINEANTELLNTDSLNEYIKNHGGPMSGTGLSDVTAKLASPYAESPLHPDVTLFFMGYRANCAKSGIPGAWLSNDLRTVVINAVACKILSNGTISLKSTDPLAAPRIDHEYLSHQSEVQTLTWAIRFIHKLVKSPALKKYNFTAIDSIPTACASYQYDSDQYWDCYIRQNTDGENHQGCSCKMGPRCDPLAVVDHELRVHGIKRLRVADTSIMPTLVRGNTCSPAAMIAEKLVYDIKVEHKKIKRNSKKN